MRPKQFPVDTKNRPCANFLPPRLFNKSVFTFRHHTKSKTRLVQEKIRKVTLLTLFLHSPDYPVITAVKMDRLLEFLRGFNLS